MSIAQQLKQNRQKTHYQTVAAEFRTSYEYVAAIATGGREPKRGKGLKIKTRLEELANQNQS